MSVRWRVDLRTNPRILSRRMVELEFTRTPGDRRLCALEPGLLLFAAFVVRGLAEDASAGAAAAST